MAFADHPHSDPGDGRTECDVCGKWVWAIHSCKGVPVTEAARRRAYARQPDVIGFGQWESCGGPCCGGDAPQRPPRPRGDNDRRAAPDIGRELSA
jgi:hypothetical protein